MNCKLNKIGVCITTYGMENQLDAFPNLKQLIEDVKIKSILLNTSNTDEKRLKARKDLEEACEV